VSTIALIITDFGHAGDFELTLRSIAGQVIPPGELIVVASTQERAACLRAMANVEACGNTAVRVLTAQPGESESACLNRAIAVVQSDFLAFVSIGDQLASLAMVTMQCAIIDWPHAAVVYSDEDWVDGMGARMMPRFKTAWDPDAQLGFDLLGRLCLMDVGAVRRIGGLREGFASALYYDLHCRLSSMLVGSAIRHVPAVLYHRQAPLKSDVSEERHSLNVYTTGARQAAADAAHALLGEPVEVVPVPEAPFIQHIIWPLPEPLPKVSILIPTRDRADLLENCVSGVVERTDYPNIELLILDNGSVEPQTQLLFERLSTDSRVRILPVPGPFNFSLINNQGVAAASGDIILLMNNDVEVLGDDQWLRELVSLAARLDIGCVGVKLLYGDRRIQHAGVLLQEGPLAMHAFRLGSELDLGSDGQLAGLRSYLAVTAACLAVRRSVFEEVGGFDAVNHRVAYNDIDLCLRAADAGYRNVCSPFSPLLHWESASRGAQESPEKQAQDRFELTHAVNRWRDRFENDPFMNPQLRHTWDGGLQFSQSSESHEWIVRAR
jgi:GT2 family glycosyltransferase